MKLLKIFGYSHLDIDAQYSPKGQWAFKIGTLSPLVGKKTLQYHKGTLGKISHHESLLFAAWVVDLSAPIIHLMNVKNMHESWEMTPKASSNIHANRIFK